ncbi:MAG: hypothetical protein AAGJ18_04405, partial [Bacteroidota bacterium]
NFNNKINPTASHVVLKGDYHSDAAVLLWEAAGDFNRAEDGVLFHYTSDDVLPGVSSNHGKRIFLGYHMNGFYGNDANNGNVPTPTYAWFEPATHLTLTGKIYLDSAIILATSGCGIVDCCTQINFANGSLENGNFSSFTSIANPNGTATLTTFGGSAAVDWNPTGGLGGYGSPIDYFGANPGYWVDASTNGGLGSVDGNRFYWLEPRLAANSSDCIGAVNGSDLLGNFCQGDIVEFCGYVAAYDPNGVNGGGVGTDFTFEIHTNNGTDPADFISIPTGAINIDDNGDDGESFTLPLPFSNNILDIAGTPFTGANGQVVDWRTLHWQLVCFQVQLKADQSDYGSIAFSMVDGSGGMAVDNLSIRDASTPNAGQDTSLYTCSGVVNLNDAQSGEIWSKVAEPIGANAIINTTTGFVTDMSVDGEYKFLLSKTAMTNCHDTVRVLVSCPIEICDDNIDNDGDGLIDCEDPDCRTMSISNLAFSNCVANGNQYQATLTVEVRWSNPPAGENIGITTNGITEFIDVVNGVSSPSTVQFTVPADNSQDIPISLAYSGGSGCGFTSTYNAPSPCSTPTERDRT